MATADNGNFDFAIELPDATLSARLINQIAAIPLSPAPLQLQQPGVFTGLLQINPTITLRPRRHPRVFS